QAARQARHRGDLAAKRGDQRRHLAPRARRRAGDGRCGLRRDHRLAPGRDPPDRDDAARGAGRVRRQDLRAGTLSSRGLAQGGRDFGAEQRRAPRGLGEVRVPGGNFGDHHRDAHHHRADPHEPAHPRRRSDAGEPRGVGHPRPVRRGRKARVSLPRLSVRRIRAAGVEVPMKLPLSTSAGTIRSAPLLLIDLETEEGITGRSYLFCYLSAAAPAIATVLGEVERNVKGERVAPADLWDKLARRFKLIGVQGIVRMAMSGFDVACWDALALAAGKPLVALLGGEPRPIPAYNSNGLGLMAPEAAADEAEKLLTRGFRAVKLRLGHPSPAADLAAVRAVRNRLPDSVELMVDYNQALTFVQALERGRALDSEGIAWIEEPIRHDDFRNCAELAATLATPIQIGENFSLPEQMGEAILARACDFVMPDLERI